ncbi:F5/8 type C domain-containing protein [Toxoplasma gondii VAND]|uniref:F5/8 type C domain-containing protein n=3 Tax=Toxoplasma gondii TaxID=5811 RepID=A0A086Q4V2_TOXGO|nr:F5/8 type C domain-containing protein [Toxoplasma gondii VAND]KFH07634.1 F5/8 type C domain-containing protein [Toxoplasma gondii MAS]PUA85648.1 F5/8 type C domain-containing protein [Toxoplasma gondii TgCATBr9]
MTNVATSKQTKASHPRPGDTSHGPGFAVDGHSVTYWASQNFPVNAVPAAVFFDIDLGEKYKLNTAVIDWEYPAMSYSISTSIDGKTFTLCTRNHVNSLYSTLDDMKSSVGRYVRLTLEKPHPVNGRIDDNLLYGIREFAIYSNRLRSIVQSCGVAKNSSDARDKYFLELVAEVDFTSGNELHNASEAVAKASAQVAEHEMELEAAMPMLVTCKADKDQAKQKLVSFEGRYGSLSDQLADLGARYFISHGFFGPPSTSSLTPGYSEASPVTDCYILKNSMPQVISGFYYVAPNCAPKVLRAYCDSEYGGTYFVPPAYGLEPIHLHSAGQLTSLHRMLKLMGVDLNNPVPLGIGDGRGSFYSLDMKKDITGYVLDAGALEGQGRNTVGIGGEGLVFFDSSEVEMSAIICSTNQDALNPPPAYTDVSCATPPGGNVAFDGPPGTSLTVKCPQNCLFTAEGALVVGGEEGNYSDDSSICLAAIHAGVLGRSGLVRVHMVQAPNEFEGSGSNGVISESYSGPRASRAFRLESVAVKCPQATQETETASSFLELNANRDQPSLSTELKMTGVSPDAGAQPPATSDTQTTAATRAAIRQLEVLVNSRLGSINAAVVKMVEAEANKVTSHYLTTLGSNMNYFYSPPQIISEARGILKPAGVLEEELRSRAARLLSKTMTLADSLKAAAGRVASTLESTNQQLQQVILTRASQTQADSWALTAFHPLEFYDVFEVYNSKTAIGTGNWRVGEAPAGGRGGRSILSQTAVVAPANRGVAAVGTYASVRNKRFFDGIFSTDVYISGSGSAGIAFRMKDFENMFLFEMRQSNGGFKRLLRIVDGKPVEVSRVDDGGYLEGKWYTVRIEMREARLRIIVVEESTAPVVVEPPAIFDLIDGSLMSGSIGFFTSGVDGAYFDMIQVDALPCVLRTEALPPKPATCSNYKEMFVGSLRKNWSVSESDTIGGPARWEYRTNVGGEPKVFAQMVRATTNESTPVADTLHSCSCTIAVLGGNRGCDSGVFSFKAFPQCESGIVGAVFRYMDTHNYMLFEMGPNFARLRKRADGSFTTAAKSLLGGYKIGEWNSITITFNGGTVIVNAGRGGSPIPVFSVIGTESWDGGSVGFTTWNCGGVAFADITLRPFQETRIVPNPVNSPVSVFTEVDTRTEAGMQVCLNRKHAPDRAEFCNKIQKKGGTVTEKCKTNFCDVCCEEELPISVKARNDCKRQCHKNDGESTSVLEALESVKSGCSIEGSKPIYRFCETEADQQKCQQVCVMCCETAKVPFDQPYRARRFVARECKNSCTVPAAQQEL